MSGKKRVSNESFTQQTIKEQLLGSEDDQAFSGEKRDVLVTVRMKGRIVDLLAALTELDILDSRSEAIASIVESTVSSKSKLFKALKTQADDLKRRRDAARQLASDEIRRGLD
jgi:hypothetical protein